MKSGTISRFSTLLILLSELPSAYSFANVRRNTPRVRVPILSLPQDAPSHVLSPVYSSINDELEIAESISSTPPPPQVVQSPEQMVLSSAMMDTSTERADVDALSLWKRRLITKEDPWSVHKISSIVYSLSAIIIMGTGAVRYLQSPEIFSEIPSFLQLPTYTFTISNIIMCAASIQMAFQHRAGNLTARNAFLGTAASSLFSGFYFLWTSPFGPEVFNVHIVTQMCFATLVLLNVVFIMDTVLKTPEVVESRRDRKADGYKGQFWVDTMGYVLPVAWALPVILVTAYTDAIAFDRSWFFEQCRYADETRGILGMNANLNYLQVAGSLAASYGALFVTLRDKKLISKNQELVGISLFSVPTLIWTILVSVEFLGYIQW